MTNNIKRTVCFIGLATLSLNCLSYETSLDKQNKIVNEQPRHVDNIAEKQMLQARLAKTNQFSAKFTQQVLDEDSNILQTSIGQLSVKRPNLVHWQVNTPEESLIISDGINLWLFDPFIEQATVYRVDSSIENTPILLLTTDDDSYWQHYVVKRNSDNEYVITSKDDNARIKSLTLRFASDSSTLSSFSIVDATGQYSVVTLENVISKPLKNDDIFKFTVPEGVYLDDQR